LIYATDVSHQALSKAAEGVYDHSRLATFEDNYRQAGGELSFERYCSMAYGHIVMQESLRNNMAFFHHNLVTDHGLGEMQVVFCRNVLMYFSGVLSKRVLDVLTRALCGGGFLCLGANEQLPPYLDACFEEYVRGRRIYRLRGARGGS
jgi:chemotaxis protein methyltransferase CheR